MDRIRARTLLASLCVATICAAPSLRARAQASPASADKAPEGDAETPTARARAQFNRGVSLVDNREYGSALEAFQQAANLSPSPLTSYNIGYCQRATGLYVAARRTFKALLASSAGLDRTQIAQAKAYVEHVDSLVVRLNVTLDPASAVLKVDGHGVEAVPEDTTEVMVVSGSTGTSTSLNRAHFALLVDPGVHIFQAGRPGHADAFVQRAFKPGAKETLDLELDLLPARVTVRSDPAQSILRLKDGENWREAGLTPIDIERPAGKYELEVGHDGFEPYVATLSLSAGEHLFLNPKMSPYRPPPYKTPWFWGIVGGGVAAAIGIAAAVVLATRPEAPLDGGSLNWVVTPSTFKF